MVVVMRTSFIFNMLYSTHDENVAHNDWPFCSLQSWQPGSVPKDKARVVELARSFTIEAIETLLELMRHGNDKHVRGTAAPALLDRVWGRSKVGVVTEAGGAGYLEALRQVGYRE